MPSTSAELGLGQDTYRAKGNLADFLWVAEGPQAGLDMMREGVEWAKDDGIMAPFYWGQSESMWMLLDLGRWDELLSLEDEIVSWGRELGGRYMETVAASYAAQVLVWRGQTAKAARGSNGSSPRPRRFAIRRSSCRPWRSPQ